MELPTHCEAVSIETADRVYDRTNRELLIVEGWDETDIVAHRPGDSGVLIEDARESFRYQPVTVDSLKA
jgi:hypothetical protein